MAALANSPPPIAFRDVSLELWRGPPELLNELFVAFNKTVKKVGLLTSRYSKFHLCSSFADPHVSSKYSLPRASQMLAPKSNCAESICPHRVS